MTKHEALRPADSLKEEERTENHWVGTAGDLVVLFLYDGAVSDPRHVEITSHVLKRTSLKLGRTCPFLVVLRSHAGKPPDSSVRSAVRESLEKSNRYVSRAAIVILGEAPDPVERHAHHTKVGRHHHRRDFRPVRGQSPESSGRTRRLRLLKPDRTIQTHEEPGDGRPHGRLVERVTHFLR